MTERAPQPKSNPGSAAKETVSSGQVQERTPEALVRLLAIRPDADSRMVEDAFKDFLSAVRSDAHRLETGDSDVFELQIQSLFKALENASSAQALPEPIRDALRKVPVIVKGFLKGTGNFGSIEGLKTAAASEWYMRRIAEVLETLAKKADEHVIEIELAQVLYVKEGVSGELEDLVKDREAYDPFDDEGQEDIDKKIQVLEKRLDVLESQHEELEEQRLLQDEAMLLESGLYYVASKLTSAEQALLIKRLDGLKIGSTEERSRDVLVLEKKLAKHFQQASKALKQNTRGLETEFLRREWRGGVVPAAELRGSTLRLLNDLFVLYGPDIWRPRRGMAVDPEHEKVARMPEDIRALLLIYKIQEKRGVFSALYHRPWLPFPINPHNGMLLAKMRESLLLTITQEKLRELAQSPETGERVLKYQETIKGLEPYLDALVRAVNAVRSEKGGKNVTLNELDQVSTSEFMAAIRRSGINVGEIFPILRDAKAALRGVSLEKGARAAAEDIFPPLLLTQEDRTRWSESTIRALLREVETLNYQIRKNKREVWSRGAIIRILRSSQNIRADFKKQLPPEEDPAREIWTAILPESELETVAKTDVEKRKLMSILNGVIKTFIRERFLLEQRRDELLSKARSYQEKVTSAGGRDVVGGWEEKGRQRAEERMEDRRERGEEEREPRGKDEFLYAQPKSAEELVESGRKIWWEAPLATQKEFSGTTREELGGIITEYDRLKAIKKEAGDISSEDEDRLDNVLRQMVVLSRVRNERAVRSGLRSLRRAAEAILGITPPEELAARIKKVGESYDRERKRGRVEGEENVAVSSAEATEKKKGKKGKSKKDEQRSAIDERHEPRSPKSKQQPQGKARKQKRK